MGINYYLIGCIEFLPLKHLQDKGYNHYKDIITDYPVLVYSSSPDKNDDSILFLEIIRNNNKTYKYIHPELIKRRYNIVTAKNIFPELFI